MLIEPYWRNIVVQPSKNPYSQTNTNVMLLLRTGWHLSILVLMLSHSKYFKGFWIPMGDFPLCKELQHFTGNVRIYVAWHCMTWQSPEVSYDRLQSQKWIPFLDLFYTFSDILRLSFAWHFLSSLSSHVTGCQGRDSSFFISLLANYVHEKKIWIKTWQCYPVHAFSTLTESVMDSV